MKEPRGIESCVNRARPYGSRDARHIRIFPDDIRNGMNALHHRIERDVLGRVDHANDDAGVLLGQKSFRNHDVEKDGRH